MQLPTEILAMILEIHYSTIKVTILQKVRQSPRLKKGDAKRKDDQQRESSFINVMLANRTLHHLGLEAFLSGADFNCVRLFRGSRAQIKGGFAQIPWKSLRFISSSPYSVYWYNEEMKYAKVDIQHLQQIKIAGR